MAIYGNALRQDRAYEEAGARLCACGCPMNQHRQDDRDIPAIVDGELVYLEIHPRREGFYCYPRCGNCRGWLAADPWDAGSAYQRADVRKEERACVSCKQDARRSLCPDCKHPVCAGCLPGHAHSREEL